MIAGLRKQKYLRQGLIITAVIGVFLCLAFNFNVFSGSQLQSSDFLFKAETVYEADGMAKDIVIVGIDDKSINEMGQFSSWPRSYYAELTDSLAQDNARVIVFDILFSEESADDAALAAAIDNAGNVILPVVKSGEAGSSTSVAGPSFLFPVSDFIAGASGIGHAHVLPDKDGIVRQLPVVIDGGEKSVPSLSLTAAAKYLRRSQVIETEDYAGTIPFAGRSIPVSDDKAMIINYAGPFDDPGEDFQTISFSDVLRGDHDSALVGDKIVLVGLTASALGDKYWTPTGNMMSGVEIHASAIHTILAADFLQPAPPPVTIALILCLAVAGGVIALSFRMRWAILAVSLIVIAYILVSLTVFDNGLMLNMLYPPLAVAVSFVGVNIYNVVSERNQKEELARTFGRYVSPEIVSKISSALEQGEISLGGEEQEVTVLFADVRGFTGIAEKIPAKELITALNVYLSDIIELVLGNGGMINKFNGDGIMAVWNAPALCHDHASLAVRAASEIQERMGELPRRMPELPEMEFGIGINTGFAVAGNIGSSDRLEYSVIGNAVNVASKITDAAPGGKVWISSETLIRLGDGVSFKALAPLVTVGKKAPISVYEITSIRPGFFQPALANAPDHIHEGGELLLINEKCNKS